MIAATGSMPPIRDPASVTAMATTSDGNMNGTVIRDFRNAEPLNDFRYRMYAPGMPSSKQIIVDTSACQTVNQSTGHTLTSLGTDPLIPGPKARLKTLSSGQ